MKISDIEAAVQWYRDKTGDDPSHITIYDKHLDDLHKELLTTVTIVEDELVEAYKYTSHKGEYRGVKIFTIDTTNNLHEEIPNVIGFPGFQVISCNDEEE